MPEFRAAWSKKTLCCTLIWSHNRKKNANELNTHDLLHNLGRFPADVLPVAVLRELQSRGSAIHDSLVELIENAINNRNVGIGSHEKNAFFAFALLIPIANNTTRPLIESLLTLPDREIDDLIGDLSTEAMPCVITNLFREQNALEIVNWIVELVNRLEPDSLNAAPLYHALTIAVQQGDLDRSTVIETLTEQLKCRADRRNDLQSALIVCELLDNSAGEIEGVDALVRSSFGRDQIDSNYMGIDSWEDSSPINTSDRSSRWTDPVSELCRWCYDYLSDDLDPVKGFSVSMRSPQQRPVSRKLVFWIESMSFASQVLTNSHTTPFDCWIVNLSLLAAQSSI